VLTNSSSLLDATSSAGLLGATGTGSLLIAAANCNTLLQHTATHCGKTLQHPATHCSTIGTGSVLIDSCTGIQLNMSTGMRKTPWGCSDWVE